MQKCSEILNKIPVSPLSTSE